MLDRVEKLHPGSVPKAQLDAAKANDDAVITKFTGAKGGLLPSWNGKDLLS